jgi:DNA-binding NtrC family response regulator
MKPTILIADDDPAQRRVLQKQVERMGYASIEAEDGDRVMAVLDGTDGPDIALVLLDLVMPGLDGMGVLDRLHERPEAPPVIVLTAHGGIDAVVSAMRAGAQDFVVKPASPERMDVSIRNALKTRTLTTEIDRERRKATGRLSLKDIITRAPSMKRVLDLAERAASSTIPVLIEGESGVGKELIARAIQGASSRKGKNFVTVNCGAIPENLVESTLFGHEKGAFTGATDKRVGKFVEADGGALFLDEVGELPLDTQVKLLRAIQEGEIDPVGAKRPVTVNTRLISATNRSLMHLVESGRFREDLYYRLSVFPITVPPLRNRREDIPFLVEHFVRKFAAEENKPVSAVASDAMDIICAAAWPGNVRQLENTIFRGVVLCDSDVLTLDDLPHLPRTRNTPLRRLGDAMRMASEKGGSEALRLAEDALGQSNGAAPSDAVRLSAEPAAAENIHDGASANPQAGPMSALGPEMAGGIPMAPPRRDPSLLPLHGPDGHMRSMDNLEADIIRSAIDRYDGKMTEVARRLGIGRSTLYRRLRDLGLDSAAE